MVSYVSVCLLNEETNESMEVFLTAEDVVRAQTDATFARELLHVAMQNKEKEDPAVEPPAVSENMKDESCDEGPFYRWPEACVFQLLETFKSKEEKLVGGKMTHKKFWDEVALVLQEKGHQVTGPQCSSKLRTMKRIFKSVKNHNNRSGVKRRTWQYFEFMDEIFGRKAWCRPVAVASSSGISIKEAKGTSENRQPKKTATATYFEQRVAEEVEREAARERRHKETMELSEKLLATFSEMNAKQAKRHKETMELLEKLLSTFSTS